MKKIERYSRKNFPWIVIFAFAIALLLVYAFEDPLAQLQLLLLENNLVWSSIAFAVVLAISIVVSPITIAPAVPFVAKVLGTELTFVLTVIGWTVGSLLAFLIARIGGDRVVEKFYPLDELYKNESRIPKEENFFTLLQMRLFGTLDSFSYYLGSQSKLSVIRFFAITIVGSLPAAFIFSYSADAIASGEKITLFALFFAIAMIAIAYITQRGWYWFDSSAEILVDKRKRIAGEICAVAALSIF